MIEHNVTFNLKHPAGSQEENDFLNAAAKLASISGVRDFAIRRQVSAKHPHSFGITMRFESQAEYESYNTDPLHCAFLEDHWFKEVDDFQESDFVEIDR